MADSTGMIIKIGRWILWATLIGLFTFVVLGSLGQALEYLDRRATAKRDAFRAEFCAGRLGYALTRSDTIVVASDEGCWDYVLEGGE
jgi:hypothetical protein